MTMLIAPRIEAPVMPASLFLECPARPEQASRMRHAVSRYLQGLGQSADTVDAVTLAVGEALNNAVSYGREEAGAQVSLCCRLTPSRVLIIEVRNPGRHFQPDLRSLCTLPDDSAIHGRGFALMSVLMDKVEVFTEDDETVVRLVKRFCE